MLKKMIDEFSEFDEELGVSTLYRVFETVAGEVIEKVTDYGGGFIDTFINKEK